MSDTKQALVRQAEPEPASPLAVMLADTDLIERVDVDKLERLLDMELKIRADEARKAFAAAKVEAQAQMVAVPERGWNSHTQSSYAKMRDIEAMLLPILRDNGFSQSIGMGDPSEKGQMRVSLTVTHAAGHSETVWTEAPADTSGKKSPLHATKSTRTYCERDLIEKYWRVPLGETVDDDGNAGSGLSFPISATEAAELRQKLPASRTEDQFCAALGIESIDAMPSGKLAQARSLLAQAGAR